MKSGSSDRRLLGGLLVSLLLHALVLLLQFGVPGMGTPGSSPPLTVVIANVAKPAQPEPPPPVADAPVPLPVVKPAPVGGMRLFDPAPQPEPVSAAAPVKAKIKLKKGPPRRAKRISPPLPAHETLEQPTKVIAQDTNVNEFALPVVRPEEAEQKTVDVKQAQVGDDDGDADASAALEAEAAKAGRLKAEQDAAAKLAEEARQLAERRSEQEAALLKAEQLAQQKLEQQKLEQQKSDQLAAEQRRAEQAKAEQQKSEQVRLEQQKAEQLRVEQQKAEQLRVEQQKLEQQRVAQQQLEQRRVEQQKAEQQRAEQQKLEQQRAEQQKLEQQRAEQQRAEQQRAERERAERQAAQAAAAHDPVQPGGAGSGGRSATPGGAGATGAAGKLPRNISGSDLANRARDLVKGLDLLSGDPPGQSARDGRRRVAVGANERDVSLRMYVESWRQKIERNASVNYPRNWADEQKKDPLVSVAVRSDGSVEEVTIIISSGRSDMDEAVRRIVRVNARYSAFPADIAKKYDVIDIRRVWRFDDALKLMEEVR
jgi:outer membrane biosynthesis protein TonB